MISKDKNSNNKETQVIVKLSTEEHLRLKWIADKFGLSLSKTIISLIPAIDVPAPTMVKIDKIRSASIHDLVPIQDSVDRDKIGALTQKLINKGWATTLAKEIKQQILDKNEDSLNVQTFRRLSRWVHPYRQTEREYYVQNVASKISKILFGKEIDRID